MSPDLLTRADIRVLFLCVTPWGLRATSVHAGVRVYTGVNVCTQMWAGVQECRWSVCMFACKYV